MTTGIMEVTIVRARDLKNTEFFGKVDPYILIQYKDQEQKSTTGRRKNLKSRLQCCVCLLGQGGRKPEWNEKFKFMVEYPPPQSDTKDEPQQKLLLKIMDHDSFTNDDYIGQATIYVKELFELGIENKKGKSEIPIQKYRVVSSNKTYHGEIQVGITFTVNWKTDKQEDGGWKKEN
ncbi:hypothetical protein ACS0TY_000876 [Phlomoides rotata]